MRRYTRWVTGLIVAGAMTASMGCGKKSEGEIPKGPQALPVKVVTAQSQSVGEYTEFLSTLKSRSSAVIQPEVDGQITKIFVRSGDRVSAGTPLLQIDARRQQATVNSQEATRQAREATYRLAEIELERKKKLFADGVVARQDLDQAQSTYNAARSDVQALEAGVRQQEVQLHYYTVKAPAAGTIGDIPVRVGDRVTNETVLTTLDRGGSDLEAYISVPAERAGDVRMGTPVEIVDGGGKVVLKTKVNFISPRIDTENQLLLLKAPIPETDHQYRNDQVIHARVIWQQMDSPVIPVLAVVRISGQAFAYVVEKDGNNAVARQRVVQLGDTVGNNYVVRSGIKPGDKIIVSGMQMLVDGMPVVPQG